MLLKAAAIGDTHITLASRWDEGSRILDFFADDIAERKVDLFIHTGDVFDKLSKALERLRFARFLQRCAETAPGFVVRGNHDAPSDLAIFDSSYLRTGHPVIIEEAARVHEFEKFLVAGVAWPKKAWMMAGRDFIDERAALQDIFRGIAQQWDRKPTAESYSSGVNKPRILAMHGMISGAKTSLGQPLVGCDMEVALADLALAEADVILLGHIHLPQGFGPVNGAPVLYTGSSRRTAYGEKEEKSYVLTEFSLYVAPATDIRADPEQADLVWRGKHREWTVKCERILMPTTPMVMLDANYADNRIVVDTPEAYSDIVGADVRLRYRCTAETREAARAAAERTRDEMLSKHSALNVTIDEQLTVVSTARVPEVATAVSLPEKLRMLRAARGETLDPIDEARLTGKLVELEGLAQ